MLFILGSFSVFSSFFQADFFGKLIFISLFLLSIISWTVMISKIRTVIRTRGRSLLFARIFENKKESLLNFNLATSYSENSPFTAIYSCLREKSLELLNKNRYFTEGVKNEEIYLSSSDIELVESQVSAIISNETKQLEKNLFVLSTVITLAPFLGLLGTVWGILLTFSGLQGGIASANSVVLSGLALALGTTVFGLVVAIPPLIGYNYLKSALAEFSGDMELFSHNLMTALEIQYRSVEKR
jgi:biopolymer transport protein TolQ